MRKKITLEKGSLSYAFLLCFITALFYLYEFFLRVAPSVITKELMQAWQVGAVGLGAIVSLFFWGYAPMQIPAGLMIDRYGPRRLLTFMVLVCSLGALIFAMSNYTVFAGFGRWMIGFGSAFAFIGALVVVARWFPPHYFAMLAGSIQFLGSVGAIFGQAPLSLAVDAIGWRETLILSALIGIVLTVLFWVFIRDYPPGEEDIDHPTLSSGKWIDELHRLRIALGKVATWSIGLYAFCIWAPISIFGSLWGVPYLTTMYKVSNSEASTMIAMLWIGIAVGSPLVGWFSDKIGRRNLPLFLCSFIGVISTLCIVYAPLSKPGMMILLFFFGFAASGQALSFGVVKDVNHPKVVGTAIGFNNMCVVLGATIFQPLVGYLLHQHTEGHLIDGIYIYSVSDYRYALILLPACYIFSCLVSLFILKETHCKHVY